MEVKEPRIQCGHGMQLFGVYNSKGFRESKNNVAESRQRYVKTKKAKEVHQPIYLVSVGFSGLLPLVSHVNQEILDM